ncbi:MAG: bacteriorhodopsin [Halobacteria archaeon]|nr:bacteriorhodopsin [Halobacteria archaeon]
MVEITDTTTWFWIGAVGMFAGMVVFVASGVRSDDETRKYYSVIAAVAFIASAAYAAMALGIGSLESDGVTVYLPRYADWLITTPLLILDLGLLAGVKRKTYAALIGSDVAMIGSGVAASLSTSWVKYVYFSAGSVAYVVLLYLLMRTLSDAARGRGVASLFQKLRNLTVVLWSVYPVVWLVGPYGTGLLEPATEIIIILYLDLITKVGFGFILVNSHDVVSSIRTPSAADTAET